MSKSELFQKTWHALLLNLKELWTNRRTERTAGGRREAKEVTQVVSPVQSRLKIVAN